jgi:hypothetical protein
LVKVNPTEQPTVPLVIVSSFAAGVSQYFQWYSIT